MNIWGKLKYNIEPVLFNSTTGEWIGNLNNDSTQDNYCYILCVSHGGSYNKSGYVYNKPFDDLIKDLSDNQLPKDNIKSWKNLNKDKYEFQKLVIAYFRNEWEHVWDYLDMSERFGDPKYITETIYFLETIKEIIDPNETNKINDCIEFLNLLECYFNIYIRPLIMAQCCGFVNQRKSDKRITKKTKYEIEKTTGDLNPELDKVAYSKLFNNSIDMGHYGYSLSKIIAKIIKKLKEYNKIQLFAKLPFLTKLHELCQNNQIRSQTLQNSINYMEIRLSLLKKNIKADTILNWIKNKNLSIILNQNTKFTSNNSFIKNIDNPLEFNKFIFVYYL